MLLANAIQDPNRPCNVGVRPRMFEHIELESVDLTEDIEATLGERSDGDSGVYCFVVALVEIAESCGCSDDVSER